MSTALIALAVLVPLVALLWLHGWIFYRRGFRDGHAQTVRESMELSEYRAADRARKHLGTPLFVDDLADRRATPRMAPGADVEP